MVNTRHRVIRVVTAVAAAVFLIPGIWAFLWPHSFYETIANFPPFNLHLFHDLGAFQFGIGVALLGSLFWRDALFVGLLGGAAGMTIHAISHIMDRNLGGRSSDPWLLSVLAVVVIAALLARAPSRNKRG